MSPRSKIIYSLIKPVFSLEIIVLCYLEGVTSYKS